MCAPPLSGSPPCIPQSRAAANPVAMLGGGVLIVLGALGMVLYLCLRRREQQ